MATTLRAQVSIASDTALPRDAAVNTWHFRTDEIDNEVGAAAAFDHLTDFYATVDVWLSSGISGVATVKIYDLEHNEPRAPIFQDDLALTPGAGSRFPNEVAICVSYRGALISGVDPKRRRGRIFLGPLDGGTGDAGTGDQAVDSGVRDGIAAAADALLTASNASDTKWAVFSPTTAGAPPWSAGELIAATTVVTAGYVDNAFDTIRSRGIAATSRALFP